MKSRMIGFALSLILGCGAAGCGTASDGDTVDCGASGSSYHYLVDELTIDLGDAAASAGFDLDGVDTNPGGSATGTGCGQADYMGIEGITGGIDNALGPSLGAVSSFIDVPTEVDSALHTGSMLIIVGVEAVDDLANDDCVEVSMLQGLPLEPASDPASPLDGAEAIAIDPESLDENGLPQVISEGTIENGLLEVRGLDLALPFEIPVGLTTVDVDIRVDNVNLQAPITDTTLGAGHSGVIGGAITLETIDAMVVAFGFPAGLAAGFAADADLHLDARIGEACDALSAGISFGAIEAANLSDLP